MNIRRNELTDEQIYHNRVKAINWLLDPSRVKAKSALRSTVDEGRCCLGHMCDALEVPSFYNEGNGDWEYGAEKNTALAPNELIEAIGLNSPQGTISDGKFKGGVMLSAINDRTDATPQEIGKYLQSVIMGGKGSPWRKIKGDFT